MLLTLFLSLVILFHSGSAEICPVGCKCLSQRVDCNEVGVDPVALNLDQTLLDCNFTGNSVGSLSKSLYANLHYLRFLVLARNKITEIEGGIFDHNSDLIEVDFSRNRITSLPNLLFRNNSKLERFYCGYNNLTHIDESLFTGLTHLKEVMLNDNQLVMVPPKTFSTNHLLHRLYLQENHLQTAYWNWMRFFEHSRSYELYLDDNPWSCDCRMKAFRTHLDKKLNWTTETDENEHRLYLPMCHNIDGSTTPVYKEDKKSFTCTSPQVITQSYCLKQGSIDECQINLSEGKPGVVVCAASGKPLAEVQLIKKLATPRPVTPKARGKVELHWNSVVSSDAGDYECVIQGFNESGNPVIFTSLIVVNVQSKSSVLGAVFGLVFLGIAIVVFVGFCYRRRCRKRAGYGLLDTIPETVIYDAGVSAFTDNSGCSSPVRYQDDCDAHEVETNNIETYDEKEVLV